MCACASIEKQKERERERYLDDSVEFYIVVVVSAREFKEVPASSRRVLVV